MTPDEKLQLFKKKHSLEEIRKASEGLGDTIEKITSFLHIPKCTRCEERRKLLNKIIPYDSSRKDPIIQREEKT